MAIKKYWLGTVGPFQYDDDLEYTGEAVKLRALRSEAQLHIEESASEADHVVRYDDLGADAVQRVSVASIADPSTELASKSGVVGQPLVAYEVDSDENLYTVYVWDTAVSTGANVPYCVAGDGGYWIAVGGRYIDGVLVSGLWDADGDTGIQVEEGADDDTIRVDAAGSEVAVIDSTTARFGGEVTANSLTPGSYDFSVRSADGSDQVGIYHDNTHAYFKWDDGSLYLQTDEGTDTDTTVEIIGKGTGQGLLKVETDVELATVSMAPLTDGSNADALHVHASAGLSGIDISADTNLAVTAPIVLTDDTLSLNQGGVDHGSLGGLGDDDHTQYVLHTDVDDTPVDGVTDDPVSSNWAYDHAASTDSHHAQSHNIASHSDTTATGAELETLTDGSSADSLHTHTSTSLSAIDISADTNLAVTAPIVLTDDTLSLNQGGISHDSIADVSADDHHAQSHNVASHSDTTATGAELETLTDDSMADTLHHHSELSASDGDPAEVLKTDAVGNVTFNDDALDIDFIMESTGQTHMFHLDAATDTVNIGGAAPLGRVPLNVSGIVQATSFLSNLYSSYGNPNFRTSVGGNMNLDVGRTLGVRDRDAGFVTVFTLDSTTGDIHCYGDLTVDGDMTGAGALDVTGDIDVVGAFTANTILSDTTLACIGGQFISVWGIGTNYGFKMGTAAEHHYGAVTGYSIKSCMSPSGTYRGWTWGKNGSIPIASLTTAGDWESAGNGIFHGDLTVDGDMTWAGALDVTGGTIARGASAGCAVSLSGCVIDTNYTRLQNSTLSSTGTAYIPIRGSVSGDIITHVAITAIEGGGVDATDSGTTLVELYCHTDGTDANAAATLLGSVTHSTIGDFSPSLTKVVTSTALGSPHTVVNNESYSLKITLTNAYDTAGTVALFNAGLIFSTRKY